MLTGRNLSILMVLWREIACKKELEIAGEVTRILHRHRYQVQGSSVERAEGSDIELLEESLRMSDGSNFLRTDDSREDRIIVLASALKTSEKETHIGLFRLVTERIPECNHQTIKVDFESAATSALKEVLPSVNVNRCFFRIKKYLDNEDVRLSIRWAALAFVNPEDEYEGWLIIHEDAPSNLKLHELFDYL
ncbi:hypothetical protein PR048_005660 [Dryococelus australis]|uniref:Uncharacterized protein n=1 Tax=Dryococelus australis TaxID=614101 RepID=A0ABQ9I9C8_9NEOP|nr:hypothetical protein PR048_005660 [Dryococelus australis]